MDAAVFGSVQIDHERLTGVVRRVLGESAAIVEEGWQCEPIKAGWGEGTSLWVLEGTARVGKRRCLWSVVLKSLAHAGERAGGHAVAWDDFTREADAYRSDALADLPGGLRVPVCYGVERGCDATTWIWLERIVPDDAPWSDERYVAAAEALGRFNGAYLAGRPVPDASWLSRGWLRHFVEASGPILADLPGLAGDGANRWMRELFHPDRLAALARLWDEREGMLGALDRLPQTFCHLDAFSGNMIGQVGTPSGAWPVVIDWAYSGIGAVGEELVPLVMMTAVHAGPAGLRRYETLVYPAYLRGLREAGWDGNPALVRLGFTAAAALRYSIGLLRLVVPGIADPASDAERAAKGMPPPEHVAVVLDACYRYADAMAEEARALRSLVA